MSAVGRYLRGVRLLGRGLGMYARSPRLLLLGLIPAVLSAVLFVGAFVLLLQFLDDLAAVATWFAADWPESSRGVARGLAAVAILGVAGLLGILSFTAVTLFLGEPFYERISRRVEAKYGPVTDEVEIGFWRGLRQNTADSLRLLAVTVPIGVPLFFAGFLPVVGQTVVPVIGASVGGWFLAHQLVGVPFSRRGLRLTHRRQALRRHRAEALGFGTAAFVCFLIPGGAILAMPAAVAGGTLLGRRALGLSIDPAARTPAGARPAGARPDGARPDGATPAGARPDGATPDGGLASGGGPGRP